jgi:hypothetical protein
MVDMNKTRRWRISIWDSEGCAKESAPDKHHACKNKERAQMLFDKYVLKEHRARVIMHQGNLKLLATAYIWLDTDWFKNVGGYTPNMARERVTL